jgi:hypothetical protein
MADGCAKHSAMIMNALMAAAIRTTAFFKIKNYFLLYALRRLTDAHTPPSIKSVSASM